MSLREAAAPSMLFFMVVLALSQLALDSLLFSFLAVLLLLSMLFIRLQPLLKHWTYYDGTVLSLTGGMVLSHACGTFDVISNNDFPLMLLGPCLYLVARLLLLCQESSIQTLRALLSVIVISSLAQALFAIWQHISLDSLTMVWADGSVPSFTTPGRTYGSFSTESPNILSIYLLFGLLANMALSEIYSARFKKYHVACLTIAQSLVITALLTTSSRAGIVTGVLASLIFLALLSRSLYSRLGLLLAWVTGSAIVSASIPLGSVTERFGWLADDPSVSSRLEVLAGTVQLSPTIPLFGLGPNPESLTYVLGIILPADIKLENLHNFFLDIFVQTGWVGLSLWLALFLQISWAAVQHYRKEHLEELYLCMILVAVGIAGLFDIALRCSPIIIPFWFCLAALSSVASKDPVREDPAV